MWVEDDYTTYVRLEALYAWNRKSQTNIKLPSKKSRDLRVYLEQEHGAVEDENYINSAGNRVRVWSFPDALELTSTQKESRPHQQLHIFTHVTHLPIPYP